MPSVHSAVVNCSSTRGEWKLNESIVLHGRFYLLPGIIFRCGSTQIKVLLPRCRTVEYVRSGALFRPRYRQEVITHLHLFRVMYCTGNYRRGGVHPRHRNPPALERGRADTIPRTHDVVQVSLRCARFVTNRLKQSVPALQATV